MAVGQTENPQKRFGAPRAEQSAPPFSASSRCAAPDCAASAATALLQQPWCVSHFLVQSYQALEQIEKNRDHTHLLRESGRADARTFLDECSLQALAVSLRSNNLSNLERGRLLDILLWAGELSESLRPTPQKSSEAQHNGVLSEPV